MTPDEPVRPAPPSIDIMRSVFAVAALKPKSEGEPLSTASLASPEFFGTAFAIAPGVYLTAAHVIRNADAAGSPVLIIPVGAGEALSSVDIIAFEIWDQFDLAAVFTEEDVATTKFDIWAGRRVDVLQDVASFGYPHATLPSRDGTRLDAVFRAYKGYVITTRGFERIQSEAAVYELSMPLPEGMSGAPALWKPPVGDYLILAGVVLGESVVEFAGVERRVGIALMVDQFAGLQSKRLGKRLGDLARSVGLQLVPTDAETVLVSRDAVAPDEPTD